MKIPFATKISFLLLTTLFFSTVLTLPVYAGTLKIGDPCKVNSDCKSGDCETSSKKDGNGNYLSFCDCDDLSATESSDCADNYGSRPGAAGSWGCVDGSPTTYDLDFCLWERDNDEQLGAADVELPIGSNPAAPTNISGMLSALMTSRATQVKLLEEVKTLVPQLSIKIPGLDFSAIGKNLETAPSGEVYMYVPFIGQLLKAIYNYSMAIVSIVGVIMIIVAGVRIIVSGGGEQKVAGYKKIGKVVVGLAIAWGSYIILYTINPSLVKFDSLKIHYVQSQDVVAFRAESESKVETATEIAQIPGVSGGSENVSGTTDKKEAAKIGNNFKATYCAQPKNPSKDNTAMVSYFTSRGFVVDNSLYGSLDCNKNANPRPDKQIDRIVLHNGFRQNEKASGKSKAAQTVAMWRTDAALITNGNPGNKIGSHFIIDRQGVIYPLIDPVFGAAHAPSQNKRSVGVDFLYDQANNTEASIFFTEAQYKSMAVLIQYLSSVFPNIKIADYNVMGHGECQGNRVDPHNFEFEKLNQYIPGASFSNAKHNRIYVNPSLKHVSDPTKYSQTCEWVKDTGKSSRKQ